MPSKNTLKASRFPTLRAVSDDQLNEQHLADERLASAIAEILSNEQTPVDLFDKVADFVVSASSGDVTVFWTPPALVHLLGFIRHNTTEELKQRGRRYKT